MKRRNWMVGTTTGVAATIFSRRALMAQVASETEDIETVATKFSRPTFIATWKFGQAACERSREVLSSGGSCADAVEKGIHVAEADEPNRSVGYGGHPNANGIVQLDACFMDGQSMKAGSVAALSGYPHPISVARRVMESTKHVMLAGEDAAAFAQAEGFAAKDMLSAGAKEAFLRWKQKQANAARTELKETNVREAEAEVPPNHDTIALLGLDQTGNMFGGCSTSGLAYKLPGRVGDSPIIGSGLYVDGNVGAAGATGVGENIMRYCATFLIVEFMRQGKSPTAACEAAIRRIADGEKRPFKELSVNFVAINKAGQVGAAGTDGSFRCAIVDNNQSLIARPKWIQ